MMKRQSTVKVRGRHVARPKAWRALVTPQRLLAMGAGFVIAALAFGHSAAQTGLPLGSAGLRAWSTPGARLQTYLLSQAQYGRFGSPQGALAASQATASEDPLNPRALTVAGLAYEQLGRKDAAFRAVSQAERLSRREKLAQLWLIKHAVARGDLPATLRHYDMVLRTVRAGNDDLHLKLVAIAQLPQGRRALQPYLRADNQWLSHFLELTAIKSQKAAPLGELLLAAPPLRADVTGAGIAKTAVTRLAAEREFDLLWRLYPRLPGAVTGLSESFEIAPRFDRAGNERPWLEPVDWEMSSTNEVGATVVVGTQRDRAAISAFAPALARGTAARKLAKLRPGRYRLTFDVLATRANPQALAQFAIGCASEAERSRSGNLFPADAAEQESRRAYFLDFAVAPGCPATIAEIVMAGGDGIDQSEIVLENLQLRPIN